MPDRAAPAGEAPAAGEVEITPEMIEAGVSALCASSPAWQSEAEIVGDVYRAMARFANSRGAGKPRP